MWVLEGVHTRRVYESAMCLSSEWRRASEMRALSSENEPSGRKHGQVSTY